MKNNTLFIKLKYLVRTHFGKCRCSGHGVYPNGVRCPGCADCLNDPDNPRPFNSMEQLAIMLEHYISERGNTYLSTDDGRVVLFVRLTAERMLQVALSPMNYPAWEISIVDATEAEMLTHIHDSLGGWFVHKDCTGLINIDSDSCVETNND